MDAARSAWRSGASPVTVVYRRGRAEMPAQAEEIEAAEREGIVVGPVSRRSRSSAAMVRSSGSAASRPDAAPAASTGGGRSADTVGAGPRHGGRAPGRDDPRRRRRGARSVHPARGRRHRGQRLGRDRRRSADPRHGPGRHLRRWRRRVGTEDDHRRGRVGPSGRRVHPRIPVRGGRRRARHPRDGPLRRPRPRVRSPSTSRRRPRAHAPLPVVQPGSFAATQVGFDETDGRAEAGRCFRCDAHLRTGRPSTYGRVGDRTTPRSRPGHHRPMSMRSLEARHDTRPGLRLLRCR